MFTRKDDSYCDKCPKPKIKYSNENPLNLFLALDTQWHHGFAGPTGLIYSEARAMAKDMGLDFVEQFDSLQICESEFLKIINEQHNKDAKK
jgi:hypothetical protein